MSNKTGPILPIAQDVVSGRRRRLVSIFLIHSAIVLTLLTGYLAPRTFWQGTPSVTLTEAYHRLTQKQAEHLFL